MRARAPGHGHPRPAAGTVVALYVGEFFGLILIRFGYDLCVKPVSVPVAATPQPA